MARLLVSDLLRAQLDAGKDEDGTDQCSGDGANGIESLGEIQASFGAVRFTQLGDEGIGRRLEERKTTGDYEESEEKEAIAAGEGGWPEQESARSEKNEPGDNN